MKAYEVQFPDDSWEIDIGMDLAFGKDLKEAKANFFYGRNVFGSYLGDCKLSDIKFYRLKAFDNLEKLPAMKIAEKLITNKCWVFEVGDKYFNEDNFDEQEFERAWMQEDGSEQVCE